MPLKDKEARKEYNKKYNKKYNEQYYSDNKQKKNEYSRLYNETHKEDLKDKRKIYQTLTFVCECGVTCRNIYKKRHELTDRHKFIMHYGIVYFEMSELETKFLKVQHKLNYTMRRWKWAIEKWEEELNNTIQ